MTSDSNRLETALLNTMTLLASLNVAAEIAFGMRERKAGRDPSAEEQKDVALPVLREELRKLKALSFQLQSSLALSQDIDVVHQEEESAASVQRFIDLVHLQKAGSSLHSIHQRLLSLYPVIDESIAEEARLLKNTCDEIKDTDPASFHDALTRFINKTRKFATRVDRMLNAST